MRVRQVISVFLVLFATPVLGADDRIVLVRDGTPQATLIVPSSASPTERFAAEEIQRYVLAISGARLPIASDEQTPDGAVVSVGRTELAAVSVDSRLPGPDPYVVKTTGRRLILLGKGDRGTIYSAYHFLEKHLGCRWVFPGELGDVVPHAKTIHVGPIDERCEPAFRFRIAAGFGYADCQDWAIKHRLQVYSPSPEAWTGEDMAKRGGYVKGTMHHAFHRLFPAEEYFADHPEYYGLVNGKRVASRNRGQLCLANPDVVALTAQRAIRFFDESPEADFFSLCPDDHQNWCECPACTAFDSTTTERWGRTFPVVSDRLMAFVNKVGERLERRHPGKLLYVFAYQNYTDPPRVHKPRPNVIVSLCHMVPACYAHPLEDPACEPNAEFMKLLTGWADTHTNMWYYAYTCKSMWQDMPWPIARRLAKDIRTLHQRRFQGFYSQGSGRRWGQLGVNTYLMAKMLWDVDTDVEAVLDDYFTHSFGPAADAMKRYYNRLEREFSKPGIVIHHQAREQAPQFLTPKVFDACFGHLAAAERAAAGDERILARIKPVRVAFEYARLYLEADRHEKAFRETDSEQELNRAVAAYQRIIKLHKEHGRHAISRGGLRLYVKPPLEKLQMAQFARTGAAEGLAFQWESRNRLGNPSFEDGPAKAPDGWKGVRATERGAAQIVDFDAHTGKRCLAMRASKRTDVRDKTGFWKADWIAVQAQSATVPVKRGQVYRVLAWIRIPKTFTDTKRGVTLGLVGYDAKGKSPQGWRAGNIEVRRTKATDGWRRLALFKRVDSPDVKTIAVRIGIAGTGSVLIDDVELVLGRETR